MDTRRLFAVSLLSAGILHAGVLGLTRLGGHTNVPPRLIAITLEAAPEEPAALASQPTMPPEPAAARAAPTEKVAPLEPGYAAPTETPADNTPAPIPAVTPPVPVDLPAALPEGEAPAGRQADSAADAPAPAVSVVTTAEQPPNALGTASPAGGPNAPRSGAPGVGPGGTPVMTTGGAGGTGAAGRTSEAVPARLSGTLAPRYPLAAKILGLEGAVRISVRLDRSGAVLSAEVLTSSGHPELDRAALEAVRKATFSPALRDGQPVPSGLVIPIRFRLSASP